MLVQDGAMGDREGGEGATAMRGVAPSNNQPHDGDDGGGGRQ